MREEGEGGIAPVAVCTAWILEVETKELLNVGQTVQRWHDAARQQVLTEGHREQVGVVRKIRMQVVGLTENGVRLGGAVERHEGVGRDDRIVHGSGSEDSP